MTRGATEPSGEEKFEDGMRNNGMERDAADADNDGRLDFDEFCQVSLSSAPRDIAASAPPHSLLLIASSSSRHHLVISSASPLDYHSITSRLPLDYILINS